MKVADKAVIDAFTNVENSRLSRNKLLYTAPAALVPVALDVKKYLKSVFGSNSPEYKQVSGIEFKIPDGL